MSAKLALCSVLVMLGCGSTERAAPTPAPVPVVEKTPTVGASVVQRVKGHTPADGSVVLVLHDDGTVVAQAPNGSWQETVLKATSKTLTYVRSQQLLYGWTELPAGPDATDPSGGFALEVTDLRVAGPPVPVRLLEYRGAESFEIAIGKLLPEGPYFHVGGGVLVDIAETAVTLRADDGVTEIMEHAETIKHIAFTPAGERWLIAQRERPSVVSPKAPAPVPVDVAASKLETCEEEACGLASPFGTTGWHSVLIERSCGDGCYVRCVLKDPKTGQYTALKQADGAFVWGTLDAVHADGFDCVVGSEPPGAHFLVDGLVCSSEGCDPVKGTALGFF
ncbi:MAG: hypothetical protein ACI9MR_000860 [Myxococcota bacterium]|jgi:hypothetical protein